MEPELELVDEEVFDFNQPHQVIAVVWWLVHLLGDKVVIPIEEDFWLTNFPETSRLVMRAEYGKLVLCSEQLDWK